MAEYIWQSEEEKVIAIGFLAIPNVIQAISATVPANLENRFRREFEGLFDSEYPYVTKPMSKYTWQFRIQLNDTDGCPEAIRNLLDERYGNRINNNALIAELVTNYGFRFKNGIQNVEQIRYCVANIHGERFLRAFDQGFGIYQSFIEEVTDIVTQSRRLPTPNILSYEPRGIARRAGRRRQSTEGTALSQRQISNLGWIGEAYIAYLLEVADSDFLASLDIPPRMGYTFNWFNRGFDEVDINSWEDQSVGRGCDIEVILDNGTTIYIEVKSSKREYPYFKMTSNEMRLMEEELENYILVKVNNLERLLDDGAPDIISILNPYEQLFHPRQMKEATFIIGGR